MHFYNEEEIFPDFLCSPQFYYLVGHIFSDKKKIIDLFRFLFFMRIVRILDFSFRWKQKKKSRIPLWWKQKSVEHEIFLLHKQVLYNEVWPFFFGKAPLLVHFYYILRVFFSMFEIIQKLLLMNIFIYKPKSISFKLYLCWFWAPWIKLALVGMLFGPHYSPNPSHAIKPWRWVLSIQVNLSN